MTENMAARGEGLAGLAFEKWWDSGEWEIPNEFTLAGDAFKAGWAAALATPSPQAPPQCTCYMEANEATNGPCPIHNAPAATQEQPAGSGALTGYELAGCADRSGVVVYLDGRIGNARLMVAGDWDRFAAEIRAATAPPALTVEQVLATYQGLCWEDQTPSGLNRGWLEFTQRLNTALALSPYHCTYCDGTHFEKNCPQRCGSPRKVGEDGAGDTLWQRCLSLVERCRDKTPDKWDFAYELEKICKEYAALAEDNPMQD